MVDGYIKRSGEWLELDDAALAFLSASPAINPHTEKDPAALPELAQPRAGSHPHMVRQWLLARSFFPQKWVNRLFSVGGIRWEGECLQLLAFPAVDPRSDAAYRNIRLSTPAISPKVLFEDDFCIVFDKPAGMAVHGSAPGESGTLDEAAARHLLRQGDPLNVRHIHRLDDETSGPVLYAKNDLAQWKLDEAMRAKLIDRQYIAVVHGQLSKANGVIDAPIGKDRHHRSRRRVSDNGEHAVSHYEVLASNGELSVIRVRLQTGRTHQIRVHLSYIGHPLAGDSLYGGDSRLLGHQALHGERLVFAHPWTNRQMEIHSPWPKWLVGLSEKIHNRSK
ncbi:RluA family pseudouridine synthase [Paenibacillus sinopodophylli]|uniref:RluA family pseudouridine synthase n=1 Tax=Paenibacillus sinopodophylli TaxID=1837342 RepID=UPI00110CF713|nr:RluA family pseudouridine synthase [Paenibacillus sinopodophylli]